MELHKALTNITRKTATTEVRPDVEWSKLTPGGLGDALRRAVRAAHESAASEQMLARCWEMARHPSCLAAIMRAQTRPNIDCVRLHHNFSGLIATAAAAAAAVRAVNVVDTDRTAPARVKQWLLRALQDLHGDAECNLEETAPATNWIFDSAESVLEAACSELAASGRHIGTPRHWARHWLNDSHAPVMIVPLAVKEASANRGDLFELRLERAPGGELIEHFDASLQPADRVLLDTLREAQQSVEIGVAWSITKRGGGSLWDVGLEGGSLGLAAYTAFRLLKEGRPYDQTCLLVGRVRDGRIEKVEGEGVKLHATFQTGRIRRVGIAPLADIQNKNVYSQLDVRTMHTIEEAAAFASGLVGQVEQILKGEVAKVVAEAGRRMGRRRYQLDSDSDALVQSWEDLKRLHLPVRVARGIRPFLSDEELRELEQRRAQGDYSGQNRVEQKRSDLREKELQERLPTKKRRQTVEWESIRKGMNRAVVTGDPGYGKTMLSWLEMEENLNGLEQLKTQEQSIYGIRFSIWMPAARLAERVGHRSAIEAIVESLNRTHTLQEDGQAWLREQLYKGHARIVLDALDEVPETLRERLNHALAEIPQDMRILLTSRLLGYAGAPFRVRKEDEVEILAFDDDQMEHAIRLWYEADESTHGVENAQALRAHIQEHWMVREILHCPLLLRLACEAADRLRQERRKLPRWETRAELYETFLDHAIHQFVQKKRAGAEVEGSLRRFASDLSLELWIQDSRRTFWGAEPLTEIVTKLRPTYPTFATRDVLEDLKAADILVPSATEEQRRPPLMYTHRTIGEYLVARALAQKLRQKDARVWVLVDKKAWDPHWRPVLLFLAGLLADLPEVLRRYVDLCGTPLTDPHQDDLFHHRLCMTAEVLAEIPEAPRTSMAERVNAVTKGVFDIYWQAWMEHTQYALPHARQAWRAAGQLNGLVGAQRLRFELVDRLDDPSPDVRRVAVWVLAEFGGTVTHDRLVVSALLDLLADSRPDVRSSALQVLRAIGESAAHDPRIVRAVLGRLNDEDSWVRAEAAGALGGLGGASVRDLPIVAALLDRLEDPDNLMVRYAAVAALGDLGHAVAHDVRVIPVLLAKLEDPYELLCDAAANALSGLGETAGRDSRVGSALMRAATSPDFTGKTAAFALDHLAQLAAHAVIPTLLDGLVDRNNQVSWQAAAALGRLGNAAASDPWVVPALLARVTDPYKTGCEQALRVLSQLGDHVAGDPRVISALAERLADPESGDLLWAPEVLASAGEKASDPRMISAVLRLLADPDSSRRRWAATVLGRLGKHAAKNSIIQSLLERLADADQFVRSAAADALRALGETAARYPGVISALVKQLADSSRFARKAAADALGMLGKVQSDNALFPALLTHIDDPDQDVQLAIAKALRQLGGKTADNPSVIEVPLNQLADKYPWKRAEAVRVLSLFAHNGDSRVIPALLAQLRDPDPEVRIAAAHALGESREEGLPAQVIDALLDRLDSAVEKELGVVAGVLARLADATPDQVIPAVISRFDNPRFARSILDSHFFRDEVTESLTSLRTRVITALRDRSSELQASLRVSAGLALGPLNETGARVFRSQLDENALDIRWVIDLARWDPIRDSSL